MSTINQEDVEMMVENTYWAELADALERLEKNEDFKKLILVGYLKDRALDAVSLLARDDIKRAGRRPDVMEGLVAISTLQDFFYTVKAMGGAAKQDIEDALEEQ